MSPRQLAYQEYLQSDHWQSLRLLALERDHFKCTICDSKHRLQVHHLKYRAKFEHSLLEDVVTLCRLCHKAAHHRINRKHLTRFMANTFRKQRERDRRELQKLYREENLRTVAANRAARKARRRPFVPVSRWHPLVPPRSPEPYAHPATPSSSSCTQPVSLPDKPAVPPDSASPGT